MTRRLSAAAVSAVLLVALAASCSKTETTSTTASTAAPPTTAAATTAAPTTEKSTETTKKSTGTTQKSGGDGMPTKDVELTPQEEACANAVYTGYLAENPTADDANKAGALGGAIVGCTTKAKVADTVLAGLKNSDFGKNITSEQESCMRDKVISLDSKELATVLGVFIYAGTTLDLGPAVQALTGLAQACDVPLNS